MSQSPEMPKPTAQESQVEMARTRTLLALDRTLLAWVRTSLSLTGFGFALAKFVHDLIGTGMIHGIDAAYPRHVGVILMLLGIGGLLGGAFDYWYAVKRLRTHVDMPSYSTALVVSLILATLSLMLMLSLMTELGGKHYGM